jgi:hypothetical protein
MRPSAPYEYDVPLLVPRCRQTARNVYGCAPWATSSSLTTSRAIIKVMRTVAVRGIRFLSAYRTGHTWI